MAKKRARQQNPEPFLADDNAITVSKKRHKSPKHHQHEQKLISSGTSSKILKEALIQQKEINEENEGKTPNNLVFAEEPAAFLEEEDINDFGGFLETQSHFGGYEEEVNEEDEKLLEAFISKNAGQTLADLIVAKIKQEDAQLSSGLPSFSEVGPLPKLDESYNDQYKRVGELLNKYTAGRIPKSFKHIPSMHLWEEVLYLTEPEKWSPTAVDEATRIFASNLGVKKAERFYKLVLFPRIREDIRKNKRLHFALCQALKKSVYKPAAFYKGILFPLCESGTCNKREAKIIGSIIQKVSIPPLDSSAALLSLAEMDFCGTTWYFIKLLIEKKYSLPYKALDAMVAHFMKFLEDERIMPVIWHQSLLAFMQRYKNELTKEDKANLTTLVGKQRHRLVTAEILREMNNSQNRGDKEDDLMSFSSPMLFVNKPIEEDRFDIPDVPIEED